MLKTIILTTIFTTILAGIIDKNHEHSGYSARQEQEPAETDHHVEVEHKHATSHQSVKIHHFHAVPVYVKKEDQEFLKHPVEIGGTKQKLKILHPETEHNHNHGLALENHYESDHNHHGNEGLEEHHQSYHHE